MESGTKFEPKGNSGVSLSLDENRKVAIFEGVDGSIMLEWHNGEVVTAVRLSKEAFRATGTLLMYVTKGVIMDSHQPPLI